MTCRVYTLSIHQNARQYEADVILSDRLVRSACGCPSRIEKALDTVMSPYRRRRGIPTPGYREPHTVRQYVVNQFNSAILSLQEHRNLQGFRPLELRQFHEILITEKRRATLRERAQFAVLGLMNISDALTPEPSTSSNKE